MTELGHNNPPSPIEEVTSQYGALLSEVENWADGDLVESKDQMDAVDALIKEFRSYKSALVKAGKEMTAPLHDAWKAEVARVKVYTDDAERIQSALVATVAPFKAKLAEEQKAKERAAWEAANKARLEAEAAAAKADAANLEQQREIEAARQAAIDAEKAAKEQAKQAVKGMRKVHKYEITDYRAFLHWIAKNDKDAITDFLNEYARKEHKVVANADGLRVWIEKEAY